jgi:hypothetical protein
MPLIERLRLDHAAAVLVFERENRAYFAASVSDRGDEYFTGFHARHRAARGAGGRSVGQGRNYRSGLTFNFLCQAGMSP